MKRSPRAPIYVLLVVLAAVSVSILGGCGSSSSSASTNFAGTQSPGDFWSWTVDNNAGTFTAVNNTKNYNYSGSVSALSGNSAGISKLSVTSTTDPGLTTLPQSAYVVELPNTALLVATAPFYNSAFSGTQLSIRPPVFAAAQGSCPSSGATVNWIIMPPANWCSTTSDANPLGNNGNGCSSGADNAYGTAQITVSGGTYTIAINSYDLAGDRDPNSPTLTGGTCSNGVIQWSDSSGNPVRVSFTPSGVFFVDMPQQAIVGIVQPSSNVDLNDFLNGRTFKALYHTALDSAGIFTTQSSCAAGGGTWVTGTCGTHSTQPVSATTDGTTFTGQGFSNIDNGTASQGGGSIGFANATQSAPGLISATFTSVGTTQSTPMVMAVRQVNGKYVALIVTSSPLATLGGGFNILAVEQ